MIIANALAKAMDALRFGKLVIVGMADRKKGQPQALCQCDCGASKTIALSSLRSGRTKSCGCYRLDHPSTKRHGRSATRTYSVWLGMRQRCLNPGNPAYPRYGGRGIGIDPRWDRFEVFLEDMGEIPDGMSLERVDNDKGYGPSNCVWADRLTQNRNTRRCRVISHKGQTKTLGEWAKEYGVNHQTLAKRLDSGWDVERALTQSPLAYHNRI